MSMTMTVSGADRSPLRRFSWPEAAAAWGSRVGPVARGAVALAAPLGKGTPGTAGMGGHVPGTLRKSISVRNEASDGAMLVVVYSTAPYAGFVTGGTRPHVIKPRARTRGGWTGPYTGGSGAGSHSLHWVSGGADVFAAQVNHPGTKPDNFPERGLAPFKPLLAQYFATAVQEAMGL